MSRGVAPNEQQAGLHGQVGQKEFSLGRGDLHSSGGERSWLGVPSLGIDPDFNTQLCRNPTRHQVPSPLFFNSSGQGLRVYFKLGLAAL